MAGRARLMINGLRCRPRERKRGEKNKERSRGLKDGEKVNGVESMIISSADGGKPKKRENGRYYGPYDDPWEILNAFQ